MITVNDPAPLLAYKDVIRANPSGHIMGEFVTYLGKNELDDATIRREVRTPEKNVCDTFCCIAGGLFIEANPDLDLRQYLYEINYIREARKMIEYRFDADDEEGEDPALFFLSSWPQYLQKAYKIAPTDAIRAEVFCRAIDFFAYVPEVFTYWNKTIREALSSGVFDTEAVLV